MRSLIIRLVQSILLLSVFFSCSDDAEEVTPENRFIKIYNDPDFSATFYALDVKQTSDNGYLILAQTRVTESDFGGVYLLKTDSEGKVIWEYKADASIVSPAPSLMEIAGSYYFICMNNTGVGTLMMKVNESGATADIEKIFPDITFPLHASTTPDGGVIILSYNRDEKNSVISKINNSFSLSWQSEYNIQEENSDEPIFDHLLNTEKRLPFFTGSLEEGGYFFNGLTNFTISLVFVDPSSGNQLGVMNGYQMDGALSAMAHIQGTQFAVSRFTFGTNYILPAIEININEVSNSEELDGNISSELAPNADVRIIKKTVNETNVIIYAANSKSNQVVLYAYDELTGELLGSKHLGFSEGFEVASIIETEDNGLAVLCTNNMAGRFSRIALFKISEGDVNILSGE